MKKNEDKNDIERSYFSLEWQFVFPSEGLMGIRCPLPLAFLTGSRKSVRKYRCLGGETVLNVPLYARNIPSEALVPRVLDSSRKVNESEADTRDPGCSEASARCLMRMYERNGYGSRLLIFFYGDRIRGYKID